MDFDKWLEEAGVKLDQLKGDAYAKLKAEKAKLDTETRRKCRLFWAPAAAVTFVLGISGGHWFF